MDNNVYEILARAMKNDKLDKDDIEALNLYIISNDKKIDYVNCLNNVNNLCEEFLKHKAYSSKWEYTILLDRDNKISRINIFEKKEIGRENASYVIKTKNTVVHLELPSSEMIDSNCYLTDSNSILMLTNIMNAVKEFNDLI